MKKSKKFLIRYSWGQKVLSVALSLLLPFGSLTPSFALPRGGAVTKGGASLSYSTNKLLINQHTSAASFSWTSFNVKSGQSVQYVTPGSSSVSMNFIGGTTPSSIEGSVTSNGILYFMNPNGLIFGSGSVVSAAGVMAFGSNKPWGIPTGSVSNGGTMTAQPGGTVALVGTNVANTGTITVPGGTIVLASGASVVPMSSSPVSSISAVTTNIERFATDDGVLSVSAAGENAGNIIVQSGMNSGTTTLGPTAVLDASAPNGGNGGEIVVNGHTVVLDETAPLNVSSPYGKSGTVTIDPVVTTVSTASGLEAIDQSQSVYLNDTGVCISITSNLNLGGYSWTPFGTGPSAAFDAVVNGNGHTVTGYTIGTSSSPYMGTYAGFVGYLGATGVIENLGVGGSIYTVGTAATVVYAGGVAGYSAGNITASHNTGAVTAIGGAAAAGAVGANGTSYGGCYLEVCVHAYSPGGNGGNGGSSTADPRRLEESLEST